MPNRLARATSPYLQQHAENPVDWWEWSPEAFAEARRRDVPILLSIGYAACHWCHVMAHESFEDDTTADQMNAGFVPVKVDREERPDVDAVYMAATQAMTGRGGWPLTCFLTPSGEPFQCGMYLPARPRIGMPSFRQVMDAVTQAWTGDGDRVREGAARVARHLSEQASTTHEPDAVDAARLEQAVRMLAGEFDQDHGGFGTAPKFPPALVLEFLLRHHERTGSSRALEMVAVTCDAMARGGVHDQLAGGFARYGVDTAWAVPHFEKMLYDNALLLRVYAHLARRTGSPLAWRVAEATAGFLLRDLRTPEAGFASSLDADTDGVEGLTYVWTPGLVVAALGPEDGRWACDLLRVSDDGTFEHGTSTLQLPYDPDDPVRWGRVCAALLDARAARPQPARDDKVVTAWNALAVLALAEAGPVLGHPEWVAAAERTANLLLDRHIVDGRLRRSSRDGVVGGAEAVLDDHALLAEALLALHQATASPRWLERALSLLDITLERFADNERVGIYRDTADSVEAGLPHRPRELTDNATPAGSSSLVNALLTASVLVQPGNSARYRDLAEQALAAIGALVPRAPRFLGHWLSAAEAMAAGPVQVAVVGVGAEADELAVRAREEVAGGAVVVAGSPTRDADVPLLAGRPLVGGRAAAYVCHGFVCDRPVTTGDELAALLRQPADVAVGETQPPSRVRMSGTLD